MLALSTSPSRRLAKLFPIRDVNVSPGIAVVRAEKLKVGRRIDAAIAILDGKSEKTVDRREKVA